MANTPYIKNNTDRLQRFKDKLKDKPTHSFKKGDILEGVDATNTFIEEVKVVDCSPYILLVKNLEYRGSIAYRIDPLNFKKYRKLSSTEIWNKRKRSLISKLIEKAMSVSSDFVTIFKLNPHGNPSTLKHYIGNWWAFFITAGSRIQCQLFFKDNNYNLYSKLDTHGPLFPKIKK